ncbi:VOC family protein [Catenuloplanes japonicus]|uniref:VOC family protein n=1 Tax=Catenuloplanes japonicus TaxID=33876 RepID=UPI0005279725|nr:VOC family protein [Catenuloplanes japonicus]
MTYDFQVAIDSADPHTQADWWAETLGWTVEPQDAAFITSMIDQGYATEAETRVYRDSLVWASGAAITHPTSGLRVLFQTVPEAKTVKNRMHFDVRVGDEKREAEVERLTARGATFLWRGSQGPHSWVTMADPEGNEFCVA